MLNSFIPLILILLQTSAQAAFDTDLPRGEKKIYLHVPERKPELCLDPVPFGGADYSESDLQQEISLCKLNVYENSAVCPKLTSSNPGLIFYSLKDGMTPKDVEALKCEGSGIKKLAKFKLSTSCSYTPSIIGYYHLSRMLGGVGQVPPAVLRTFDLQRHLSLGRIALSEADPNSMIYKTWSTLMTHLSAGSESPRKDLLLTNSFDQSYGALQMNPRGEEFYNEFFVPGPDQVTRAIGFRDKAPVALMLKDSRPLIDWLNRSKNPDSLQTFFAMKDASEMILLDTLMNQQDRFGNIHYTWQPMSLTMSMEPVISIKRMLLKDNDCGVNKDNVSKKANLLSIVRHLDPKVYKRILQLNTLIETPAVYAFFTNNLAFTEADFIGFKRNLQELTAFLKASCQAKELFLDLDFEMHFSGGLPPKALSTQNCELQ